MLNSLSSFPGFISLSNGARRFRVAGHQAIDRICEYYHSIEKRPVVPHVEPGYLGRFVPRKAGFFALQAKS